MTEKTIKKVIVSVLSAVLMFTAVLCVAPVYASAENVTKTVRVGYYISDGFQNGDSDDNIKTGYSYEYLQKVAYFTGWEYEYVYGQWADLYDMLLDGQIDVMAGMSFTEERADKMLFPDKIMGTENYYLYKHENDITISSEDLSSIEFKTVGAVKNNLMTLKLEEWAANNDVNLRITYFDDFNEVNEAFYNYDIAFVTATDNNVSADSGMTPLIGIGGSSYYLAVSKNRADLLDELNSALSSIEISEPYFLNNLQYKYFGNTAVSKLLSETEKKWLAEHKEIRIGYVNDYLPFCTKGEDGNPEGVITDIVNQWITEMELEHSLEVKYVCYETYDEMVSGLGAEEIDVMFPEASSIWHSEKNQVYETTTVVSTPLSLIYKGEYETSTMDSIAISGHSPMQRVYVDNYCQDSTIIETSSADDCLKAILKGEANCTVFTSYRAEHFVEMEEYSKLKTTQLNDVLSYCFGVKKGNVVLVSILNKGLSQLDETALTGIMFTYANTDAKYSVVDFIRDNILLTFGVVILIVSLIILSFVIYLRGQKKQKEQLTELLAQKEERIIKEQELTEQLIVAKEEADAASNAKTAFLFNMSHDIRTPMNAVMGFTELLEKYQDDPERRENYLHKIKDSSGVLLSIINNVLEMARIEKGAMEHDETACNADEFYNSICTVFQEMMDEKNITFDCRTELTNNTVYIDIIKMREVLINVISNAYKYTNVGGSVTMTAEEIPSDREGYALFRTTVADTGIGMSKEFLEHVFEEFSRESNSTANKIEGTGLGMPIVKRLTEFMGGTLEIESEKDVGTTVVIKTYHKIADESEIQSRPVDEAVAGKAENRRVLLAEDNDLNAEIAVEMLSDAGIDTDRAADGVIALEMLKKSEDGYYDLVLTDIQMPNMDGYKLAEMIRKLEGTKADIPIIAMTANAFEEDRRKAFDAGMNGYVPKPVNINVLLKEISTMLQALDRN